MEEHNNNDHLSFIGAPLPASAADTHFCFIGATGSGKTVSIKMLMQSAFPLIGRGLGHRALVYDAKRDFIPILSGIVDPSLIVPLNPFDERSFAWDMAKDIKTPANALQLATILIPPEKNTSQPFFADAARHLLSGVITALMVKAGEGWTFKDVIWTMLHQDVLVEVLAEAEETKKLVKLYFSHEGTAQNIMSTVATKLNPFTIIAALWQEPYKQERAISLVDWLKGESILVLGNDHTARSAVDALNQLIFKRASELILDQKENTQKSSEDNSISNRTWVVFDEFVRAGKLDGMVDLATEGRSKGVSIILGFQDIDGARAVYGKEVAEEIIGQCSNIAIMRLQSPETAEWASKLFGKYERIEEEKSKNTNEGDSLGIFSLLGKESSRGEGVTYRLMERTAVLSSEFMALPITNEANGINCMLFSPFFEDGKFLKPQFIEGKTFFRALWPENDSEDWEAFKIRPGSQQFLGRLEKDDWDRLGLPSVYLRIAVREEREKRANRDQHISDLAEARNLRLLAGLQDKSEKSDFNADDIESLKRTQRELELKKRKAEADKRKDALRNLAELWVLRNPSEGEEDEVESLTDDERQLFYDQLQELSGSPGIYQRPERDR
jgi:hypothetical protein